MSTSVQILIGYEKNLLYEMKPKGVVTCCCCALWTGGSVAEVATTLAAEDTGMILVTDGGILRRLGHWQNIAMCTTRLGPKRVAADREGNGEFDFERFIRILGDILEDFWTFFEEFWRN